MSTTNLSQHEDGKVPSSKGMKFGIVVSEWNSEITGQLKDGAYQTLIKHGTDKKNIIIKNVPGSFELTLGSQFFAEYTDIDAVICIGCVIKGETPHFDYICQSVTHGITELNMSYNIPFIFGVLTTINHQQAMDRAGGKHGNKGDEAAITAIKMVVLQKSFEENEK